MDQREQRACHCDATGDWHHHLFADVCAQTIAVSIGVGVIDAGAVSFDDLLRRADQAIYAAKSGGRNRVEVGPQSTADLHANSKRKQVRHV